VNKSSAISLASLAALLLAGPTLAQSTADADGPGDRVERACTTTTLPDDTKVPCSDDALNKRPGTASGMPHAPVNGVAGSGSMGAGSLGTSMGTMGTPSTGAANSGTSFPGAMGTGAASTGGAASAPAHR
jgi:hypothetical protein